ncbi:hypothetical protein [Pontibacter sp. G13]|uniref:hypothetical protein n=1 Tax=Pontibacter sp. G13 TaxID=3074898 RepID=UPI00288C1E8A|nr:hypothetical protein [Pontibacter sp. G13]WNJ20110.1 hypothetical protein RJD25_06460 [Pontibacter sp. G13]
MTSTSLYEPWSPFQKIGFRFSMIFFLLLIAFSNNGAYPFWDVLMHYPTEWLHQLIPWLAEHVFQVPYEITVFTNGSGDTTYDYLLILCYFLLAVLGATIWSLVDRQSQDYRKLYYWLSVAIRYYVGLMLIQYGMVKVIQLQFPQPGFYRLPQAYGDSSPMGLAWTFLGFSKGYNLFMGVAECAAGLLLFRRTATLGACITLGVAANVMAINFFFDVPVKIISTTLVTMSLFLLLRDGKRIWNFFLSGQAVALPRMIAPTFPQKWMRISKLVVKVLILGYALGWGSVEVYQAQYTYGSKKPQAPLHGLYEVETFVRNQDTIPPLMTDTTRWMRISIEWEGYATAYDMQARRLRFTTEFDSTANSITMTDRSDTTLFGTFTAVDLDSAHVQWSGIYGPDTLDLYLRKKQKSDFLLMNRGFHWISEYPYNR